VADELHFRRRCRQAAFAEEACNGSSAAVNVSRRVIPLQLPAEKTAQLGVMVRIKSLLDEMATKWHSVEISGAGIEIWGRRLRRQMTTPAALWERIYS